MVALTSDPIADAVQQVTDPYQQSSPHLGPSKLNAWFGCPQKYYRQYILRERTSSSPAASLGTTVHRVIEQAHLSRWTSADADVAAKLLLDMWETVRGCNSNPDDPDANSAVMLAANDWLPWYLHFKEAQCDVAVEEHWTIPVGSTGVMLEGTIDRVYRMNGQTVLSDVKSSKRAPSAGDLASDLQVSLYWWACREMGLQPQVAENVMLRKRGVVQTARTEEYLDAVIEETVLPAAAAIAAATENDKWPCNPGGGKYGCSFCRFQNSCVVGRG